MDTPLTNNMENLEDQEFDRFEAALQGFKDFFKGETISSPQDIERVIVSSGRSSEFINIVNNVISVNIFSQRRNAIERLLGNQFNELNGPFYRVNGLVDHDVKKSFTWIFSYMDMVKWSTVNGEINEDEYGYLAQYIPAILRALDEALEMLVLIRRFRNQEYQIDFKDYPETIGFDRYDDNHYVYAAVENEVSNLYLEINDPIDSPEVLFTISTLILNAKAMKAENIVVRVFKDNNSTIVEVLDDATEGKLPEEYIRGLQNSYRKGMNNPTDPLLDSEGGGKLSSFLAGQRYGLENPLTTHIDGTPGVDLISKDGKLKGLRIVFNNVTLKERLSKLGLNYFLTWFESFSVLTEDSSLEGAVNWLNTFLQDLDSLHNFIDFVAYEASNTKEVMQFRALLTEFLKSKLQPLIDKMYKGIYPSLDEIQSFAALCIDLTNASKEEGGISKKILELEIPSEDIHLESA
ncbi:MAG: hypothetical protein IAE91_09855 [Ignavibacteriaceae bacterium]|nr:hypothetical protein [Ignavibacteriaceae bacterium]